MAAKQLTESHAAHEVLAYAARGPEFTFWCTCWGTPALQPGSAAAEAFAYLLALSECRPPLELSKPARELLAHAGFDRARYDAELGRRRQASLLLDSLEDAQRTAAGFRVMRKPVTVA